ncbi:MAG: FixH family protein [Elusimicrobia bacterium]|nr:FixH family protein [Elusimicrobiota bacterium]
MATLTMVAGTEPGRAMGFEVDVPGWPGAEASFTADMAHPGMKPIVVKASETAPGRYEGVIAWTMPGDWKVFFEARWPDGTKVERSADITVTRD